MNTNKSEEGALAFFSKVMAQFFLIGELKRNYLCDGTITKYPEIYSYKVNIYTVVLEPKIRIKRA